MHLLQPKILTVAVSAVLAFGLTACGGGGNVQSTPPPPVTPTTPPPTPPPSSPPPAQPALDAHLALTNTYAARAAGLTGRGSIIGVVDSGVNRNNPALAGRVIKNLTYVNSTTNNLAVDDVVGHGTAVSMTIAGAALDNWPGGIAPGAQIVSARIISDTRPTDDGSGQGNVVEGSGGMEFVHQDLIAAGARIMNNSWGGLYWTSQSGTNSWVAAYVPFVIDHGGIVVFANGNSGEDSRYRSNPSDNAALPSKFGAALLEKGWLTVGAIDSNHPDTLASYSQQCGVAMNYCLVAPGNIILPDSNATTTSPTRYIWTGTSFAAPQVAGAVAVVWEAFPYFDNDLVRQTILGGATDLGVAGVDPVFGHGLLNVGKAAQGPSRFDWGDVHVSFVGGTSVWSNQISGSGGLVKAGSGTLVLSANSTYTGATRIDGGSLRLDSGLTGSSVSIKPGGTLAGQGTITANIDNHGTLVNDKLIGFSIGGNYLHGADATLSFWIGRALRIAGQAVLQGGTVNVLGVRDGYVTQARENVLNAQGGVNGTFASLSSAPGVFLQAGFSYDPTNVWLDIARLNVTATAQSMGLSAAALASAPRVESAMAAIDTQVVADPAGVGAIGGDFIAAAAGIQRLSTPQAAAASLRSLSGELYAGVAAMTYEGIDAGRRALSSRFDDLAAQPGRTGAWQRNLGQDGQLAQAGYSRMDYAISGQMFGQDLRLGEDGVLGIAASQGRESGWLQGNGDSSQGRQREAQLYAGLLRGQGYLQGRVGAGSFDRIVNRQLLLGTQASGVSAQYSGRYGMAHLEGGYRLTPGRMHLTPYLAAQYAQVSNDDFAENGGRGFGLRVGADSTRRWQAISGLRAQRDWSWPAGLRLSLDARAEWQRTLLASGDVFDATFLGVEQWQPLAGIGLARDGRLFEIGLDAEFSPHRRLRLDYSDRSARGIGARQVALQYGYAF